MQRELPTHLRLEPAPTLYSDAMPDIQQVLEWQSMDGAVQKASEFNRPIFAVVVAPWSTGAHLLQRELDDAEVRSLIDEQFVPVLVNPVTQPVLCGKITALAQYQGGSGSLPLLSVLTPNLNPAFATSYTSPEQRSADAPSVNGLLQSLTEQWQADPNAFESEWEHSRDSLGLNPLVKNEEAGGYFDQSRQLHPYALVRETGDADSSSSWLVSTLSTMWDRGIRDQLEASFHPQTRDSNWVVPFFEKVIPQNAAMALVYARAAKQTGDRELRSHAQDLVRVVLGAVLKGTDVLSGESRYYTWESTEVYDTVSRQNLQALSLMYNIQPNARRQVLSRARSIDELAQISYESVQDHEKRFLTGNAELLMHRRTRPAPRPVSMESQAWRAETWRWLFLAMETLDSSDRTTLKSGYLGWLKEVEATALGEWSGSPTEFQGAVSVLASLLAARQQIDDSGIDELIALTRERVISGINHWNQVDAVERIWLDQDGYLPSVASTLRFISDMLPDDDALPTLNPAGGNHTG